MDDEGINFYENTEKLLSMLDSNYKEIDRLIDKVVKSIKNEPNDKGYLILLSLCRLLEKKIPISDEQLAWYEFVANRVAKLKDSSV